ncbi:cell division protein FtsQ/DivIB [Litoreibacter arenae]|uniref:Cell division protein FtsQ n=1 Tax=Litoreibacter arenae DSM 19593 TaxID=1123360 RepID=S9QNR9_9RHOB|nr:cell division protein FtsQ/DivIB [Litoreibacter arenae]EPX81258.1 Cell division protein FtsQ [Litoreibacter arenae DSM 19593]
MRPLNRFSKKQSSSDPAPSRMSYRMERLWLTPSFRKIVRVGMPSFLVVASLGVYFSNADRQQAIADKYTEIRRSVEERPEFMVKLMAIDGASAGLNSAIREVMPVDLPLSSFDLDLEAMRKQVESLDAVKRVDVRVRAGGLLQINVEERVPAVVWRGPGGLELLDQDGHRVSALDSRAARPDLPLIAGEGANAAVPEALALLDRAAPIKDRVIGIVRISERRWDLVLDRAQRIMLPPKEAEPALDRVLALNEAQDLLKRDVTHIDIRNPDRPTLRMTSDALATMREMQGIKVNSN